MRFQLARTERIERSEDLEPETWNLEYRTKAQGIHHLRHDLIMTIHSGIQETFGRFAPVTYIPGRFLGSFGQM